MMRSAKLHRSPVVFITLLIAGRVGHFLGLLKIEQRAQVLLERVELADLLRGPLQPCIAFDPFFLWKIREPLRHCGAEGTKALRLT